MGQKRRTVPEDRHGFYDLLLHSWLFFGWLYRNVVVLWSSFLQPFCAFFFGTFWELQLPLDDVLENFANPWTVPLAIQRRADFASLEC